MMMTSGGPAEAKGFEIDKEILDKAIKCKYNFVCLSNDGTMDEVDCCINNEIIFVKKVQHQYCGYAMNFGNSFICNCPVRKAIFLKYKK